MASLQELLDQKKALDHQITSMRTAERAEAISKVRALMVEHGLTAADLQSQPSKKDSKGLGKKVAAKYRDPETGSTWTGRGLKPRWLSEALSAGKNLADYAL